MATSARPPPDISDQSPPPLPPKRKLHTDDEPLPGLPAANKRPKKAGTKRKVIGGLTIVRDNPQTQLSSNTELWAGAPSLASTSGNPSRQTSRGASPTPLLSRFTGLKQTLPVSGPSDVQLETSTGLPPTVLPPSPSTIKGKARQREPTPSDDSATTSARPNGIASSSRAASMDVFGDVRAIPSSSIASKDFPLPLPLRETPQIDRSRQMRAEASERRRNSIEHRRRGSESIGKSGGISASSAALSYANSTSDRPGDLLHDDDNGGNLVTTGPILLVAPHPTVEPKQYHRYISTEVPPAQRVRQLLVWTLSHAQSQASLNSKRSLPVLSAESTRILRRVQDSVIRQLAGGSIDTSVYSSSSKGKEREDGSRPLKPNPRNVKNQERLQKWGDNIERAQAECQVWQDILKLANQYLAQKRAASESMKEKTLADWLHHLDERWQASAELAERALLSSSSTGEDTRLQGMLRDVHHDVDTLHSDVNTISEVTHRVDTFLSKYFSTISLNIDSRGTRTGAPSTMDIITTVKPPSTAADDLFYVDTESTSRDMFAALRAMSRLEPSEGRSERSGAVTRAVNELEGRGERKITAVPLTPGRTPRKVVPTPGRKR